MPEPDDIPLVTRLSPEDFDALVTRLDRPAAFCPRIARVLLRQAPWDDGVHNDVDNQPSCDETSTPEDA